MKKLSLFFTALAVCLLFTFCTKENQLSKEKAIIGSWVEDTEDITTYYEFCSNGTLIHYLSSGWDSGVRGSYSDGVLYLPSGYHWKVLEEVTYTWRDGRLYYFFGGYDVEIVNENLHRQNGCDYYRVKSFSTK